MNNKRCSSNRLSKWNVWMIRPSSKPPPSPLLTVRCQDSPRALKHQAAARRSSAVCNCFGLDTVWYGKQTRTMSIRGGGRGIERECNGIKTSYKRPGSLRWNKGCQSLIAVGGWFTVRELHSMDVFRSASVLMRSMEVIKWVLLAYWPQTRFVFTLIKLVSENNGSWLVYTSAALFCVALCCVFAFVIVDHLLTRPCIKVWVD